MPGVLKTVVKKTAGRARGRAWLAAVALAALTACGGGAEQIEPFAPTRILAFGDEMSVLTSAGKKYSINAVDATTGALKCDNNPLWIQTVAATFSLVFAECNPNNVAAPTGKIYAQSGATVAGLKAQIDAHLATGSFDDKTLVTVLAGANDMLELYAQFPALQQDTLVAMASERGAAYADQINRIANAGGRVIAATLPNLGYSPFAIKENADKPGTPSRIQLLTAMTAAFNKQIVLKLTNDGRQQGLILFDERIEDIVERFELYGYSNVTSAACASTVALPECSEKTLVEGASAGKWLWATDRVLGAIAQSQLGTLAQGRALSLPF